MAFLKLPLFKLPMFSYESTLDGADYRLSYKWNDIDESWFFSIEGITDPTVILKGATLRNNSPVVFNCGIYQLGEFVLFGENEPGLDMADTHRLIYREVVV